MWKTAFINLKYGLKFCIKIFLGNTWEIKGDRYELKI